MVILVRTLLFAATACGIGYCLFSLWCLLKFRSVKRIPADAEFTPAVSILKPLCGLDPHGYESLRSHCIQDYPVYEIVFGISTVDDPAAAAVERLIQEFPNLSIRLVVCSNVFGMNLKVSNLLQMLPAASHPYVVINDSDIDVPRNYLRKVIAPLRDESVGMVTCLYRGIPTQNFGSLLESMAITCDFVPGVLCSRHLDHGIRFALGSTMALHRNVLERIGGFQGIADYLADDYELGRRVSTAGLQIAIADCVVDHYLPAYSWKSFFQHQLRWARTIRSCRPEGYAGLIFTFVLPWSVFAWGMAPSLPLAWGAIAIALILRLMITIIAGTSVLHDHRVFRTLWLVLIRDFVALLIWSLAYTGSSITWRGNKFELSNGKLRPA